MNRSCHSLQKVTVSNSLSSLCKNEGHEWFAQVSSKSLSKTSNSLEKIHIFHHVIVNFYFPSLFYAQEWITPFAQWLFYKLLFYKEGDKSNCSYRSLQKSNPEKITPVVLYKRATVSKSLLSLMKKRATWKICCFAHKKTIHSKNRWANSQPWLSDWKNWIFQFLSYSIGRIQDSDP